MSILPGTRCRLVRAITFPRGIIRNLGRKLFTVRFDGGQQLIVFAHEIEFASEELAA